MYQMWARMEGRRWCDDKLRAAGAIASALDSQAICYCVDQQTDGVLSHQAILTLADAMGQDHIWRYVDRLVAVGRWTVGQVEPRSNPGRTQVETGSESGRSNRSNCYWMVKHFLDYNPRKTEVDALSRRRAEAGRKGGLAKQSAKQLLKHQPNPEEPSNPDGLLGSSSVGPLQRTDSNGAAPSGGTVSPVLARQAVNDAFDSDDGAWEDLGYRQPNKRQKEDTRLDTRGRPLYHRFADEDPL